MGSGEFPSPTDQDADSTCPFCSSKWERLGVGFEGADRVLASSAACRCSWPTCRSSRHPEKASSAGSKNVPARAQQLDGLIGLIIMAPSIGHIVQHHGAKHPNGSPHRVRSRNDISLHASTFKATANPHIVHVKRVLRAQLNNPKQGIEETGLNQITSASSYHGGALWILNIDSVDKFGAAPVQAARDRTRKLRENLASYPVHSRV